MINFRFHLLSLVAVFLALAIGIVMGTTVIDEAIVDGLRNRINAVEDDADAQRAANDRLDNENGDLRDAIEQLAPHAVDGRLDGVAVAPIAERGVDDEVIRATVALVEAAGGQVSGVLWLEERWRLDDDETVAELESILGLNRSPERDRQEAWQQIADRVAAGAAPADGPDVLAALVDAGFVTFEPTAEDTDAQLTLSEWPGADARALLVDGRAGLLEVPEMMIDAATSFVAADVPLVIGEAFDDGDDERGTILAPVRDSDLVDSVATVDDLDRVEGRVAAVLALDEVGQGVFGHYGLGQGAQQSIPERSP